MDDRPESWFSKHPVTSHHFFFYLSQALGDPIIHANTSNTWLSQETTQGLDYYSKDIFQYEYDLTHELDSLSKEIELKDLSQMEPNGWVLPMMNQ